MTTSSSNLFFIGKLYGIDSSFFFRGCLSRRANACEARAGFRYPAQTRVPTRFKRGRWARSWQALLVVYVPQQHCVEPGTVHCCCDVVSCAIRTKLKLRKSAGLLALSSDLQQLPAGHQHHDLAILLHDDRDATPIQSRQLCSVCTSTWSTPCVVTYRQPPCVLRSGSESRTLGVLYLRAKSA